MKEKTQPSLTFTEGPIFSSLIRFALPVLGSLILQAAYGAVDLLVVGWFGDAASISAVGTGSTFMQMVTLIITYNVISGILRGVGNASLPFLFVGIACVVNIVGDLLLVGVFHMDVAGAAIATVLAQFVSVVVSLAVLRRQSLPISFSLKQCRCYPGELRRILHVGVPIAIQETMVQISFLVINSIVNNMGLMPSAGYGVAQKIVSFIMLVPSSVMQSLSAFVAQNIGAGRKDRAWKGFFTAMASGCTLGIFIFLAGFFGGGFLSSFFTSDTQVIAQSAAYLKGFSAECILTCILFSSIGYFNGCGNSLPVMVQGISSAFLIRIPVSLFMASLPNTSLTLVGLSTPITTVYGILFFLVCFAWMKRKRRL